MSSWLIAILLEALKLLGAQVAQGLNDYFARRRTEQDALTGAIAKAEAETSDVLGDIADARSTLPPVATDAHGLAERLRHTAAAARSGGRG